MIKNHIGDFFMIEDIRIKLALSPDIDTLMALIDRLEHTTVDVFSQHDIDACFNSYPALLAFAIHIPLDTQKKIVEKNPNDIVLIQKSCLDESIVNSVYEQVDMANSVTTCYIKGDDSVRMYLTMKYPAFIEMIPASAKKRDLVDTSNGGDSSI